MAWKADTYDRAIDAAEKYYDEVLVKLGMFPGELKKLPPDREQAILALANESVKEIRNKFPENEYDENKANVLNNYGTDEMMKWLHGYGVDPIVAKRREDFNAMQSLINPDASKGQKSWTQMSKPELEHYMQQFGFDSRSKDDYKKFIDLVSQHQLNFDRAKVTAEEMRSPAGVAAMILDPTASQEAIRQSLTGDYDDRRMQAAKWTDIATAGLLGGATRFPSAIGTAGAAMGIETARQFANEAFGNEANWDAPLFAIGAGLAPKGGRFFTSNFSRGKEPRMTSFSRGFRRGLRGFNDSMTEEQDALKNLLISGHEKSTLARNDAKDKLRALGFRSGEEEANIERGIASANENMNVARANYEQGINAANDNLNVAKANLEYVTNPPKVDPISPRDAKLNELDAKYTKKGVVGEFEGGEGLAGVYVSRASLPLKRGYRWMLGGDGEYKVVKKSDIKDLEQLSDKVELPPDPYPGFTKNEAVKAAKQEYQAAEKAVEKAKGATKEMDAAAKEVEKANKEKLKYDVTHGYFGQPLNERPYIEQVIGDPNGVLPANTPKVSVEDVLTKYYRKPMDVANYRKPEFEQETKYIFNAFPEKYSREVGRDGSKAWYNFGVGAGKFMGGVLSPIEAAFHVTPADVVRMKKGKVPEDRTERFRQTEWYKNLPEQKKMAIERALKGEK